MPGLAAGTHLGAQGTTRIDRPENIKKKLKNGGKSKF